MDSIDTDTLLGTQLLVSRGRMLAGEPSRPLTKMAAETSTRRRGVSKDTPLKFNTWEPETQSLEKEIPFGNHHFQVSCAIFFGAMDAFSFKD